MLGVELGHFIEGRQTAFQRAHRERGFAFGQVQQIDGLLCT